MVQPLTWLQNKKEKALSEGTELEGLIYKCRTSTTDVQWAMRNSDQGMRLSFNVSLGVMEPEDS